MTRANLPANLEANGVRIAITNKTMVRVMVVQDGFLRLQHFPVGGEKYVPFVGESIEVFGTLDAKHDSIAAERVDLLPPLDNFEVSGSAVIDFVPDASALPPGEVMVRADGYKLLLTAKTKFQSSSLRTYMQAAKTNVWLLYHGNRRADGVFELDDVLAEDNAILSRETKLRAKTDYAPDQVDPAAHQSDLSKSLIGLNPKKIPPYQDKAMQARIDRIGSRLIPAYQKELPESDPTKISFRFQLIDQKKWPDALTLPSGIILVPKQIVEKLTDDSQLATILADNIACALEKQTLLDIPADQKIVAAEYAGAAAGILIPGVGIAAGVAQVATSHAAAVVIRHNEEQSARVGLTLLSDAGYDILQAPAAWSNLDQKKPGKIAPRAALVYQAIANANQRSLPTTSAPIP